MLLGDFSAFPVAWMLAVALATWAGRADFNTLMPFSSPSGVLFSLGAVLAIVAFAAGGQYTQRASYWEEVRVIWRYLVVLALFNFSLSFFVQIAYTRTVVLLAWALTLFLLPLARLLAREILARLGWWKLPALVVGNGSYAHEACTAIAQERHLGLQVTGLVSLNALQSQIPANTLPAIDEFVCEGQTIPVYPLSSGIESLAHQLGCATIVVALDETDQARQATLVSSLHPQQFEIFVVPPISGLPVQGLQAQHFLSNDTLFLRLQQNLFKRRSRLLKRAIDVLLSSCALLLFLPLLMWVAWRIWREDGAPVLYSQPRVGADGQDFQFIKFRSMVRDADAVLAAWERSDPALYERYKASNFKLTDDPRVLNVGRWIRRTSIDELPQLWNVLRCDMSLVGPRPLLRRELPEYSPDAMALYLQVRPGITGLWQVSGRSHTTFAQRSTLDSWYVRNWSLWLDWVILLKTVRVVLSGRGAM